MCCIALCPRIKGVKLLNQRESGKRSFFILFVRLVGFAPPNGREVELLRPSKHRVMDAHGLLWIFMIFMVQKCQIRHIYSALGVSRARV